MSFIHTPDLREFQQIRETIRLSFPSRLDLVPQVVRYLTEVAARLGLVDPQESNLPVALDEALTNAVIHGNQRDETKLVHVKALFTPKKMKVMVRDEGSGFDVDSLPNPITEQRLMHTSGRGIYLMRALVDEVRFNGAGNQITLVYAAEAPGENSRNRDHAHT